MSKLPKVLDIAREFSLVINERTINKKEVRAKCPFCLGDANKSTSYYLSLNTEDNVYKCWFCETGGGVLDFESKLSGIPYEEIKRKYLSSNKKFHPTESLNTAQLSRIGWKQSKTKEDFIKAKNELWEKWLDYEESTLTELFAEFLVIQYIDNIDRQKELFSYLQLRCDKSKIENAFNRIIAESRLATNQRQRWGYNGQLIARIAWDMSYEKGDIQLNTILTNIPFIHFLFRKKSKGKQFQTMTG